MERRAHQNLSKNLASKKGFFSSETGARQADSRIDSILEEISEYAQELKNKTLPYIVLENAKIETKLGAFRERLETIVKNYQVGDCDQDTRYQILKFRNQMKIFIELDTWMADFDAAKEADRNLIMEAQATNLKLMKEMRASLERLEENHGVYEVSR
jgi:hypothetical protein